MRVTRARPPEASQGRAILGRAQGGYEPADGSDLSQAIAKGAVGPNSFMKKNLAGSARARGGPPGDSTRQRTLAGSFAWIRPGAPEKTPGSPKKSSRMRIMRPENYPAIRHHDRAMTRETPMNPAFFVFLTGFWGV